MKFCAQCNMAVVFAHELNDEAGYMFKLATEWSLASACHARSVF